MLDVCLGPGDDYSIASTTFSQAPEHQPIIDPWGKAQAKKPEQNYAVSTSSYLPSS